MGTKPPINSINLGSIFNDKSVSTNCKTAGCTDESKDKQEKEKPMCCVPNVKIVTRKTQMFSMLCRINATGN